MMWGIDAGRVVFPAEWVKDVGIALAGFGGLLVLIMDAWLVTKTFPANSMHGVMAIAGKIVSLVVLLFFVGVVNGLIIYGIAEMAVRAGAIGCYFLFYTLFVPRRLSEAVMSGSRATEKFVGILFGVPLLLWALALASSGWNTAIQGSIYGSIIGAASFIASFIAAVTSTVFALLRPTWQWYHDYIDTERRETLRKKK